MRSIATDAQRPCAAIPEVFSELQRARAARKRQIRSLLFVSSGGDYESAALYHADALARALRVELHVLRVLRPQSALARFLGIRRHEDPRTCRAAAQAAKRWCDNVLPKPIPSRCFAVRPGSFVAQVTAHCAELDRPAIVLPPSTPTLGANATVLASTASRPVIVVRPRGITAKLLTAMDLHRDESSVVERAVALGQQLRTPVISMHNVGGMSGAAAMGSPVLAPLFPVSQLAAPLDVAAWIPKREPLPAIMTNEPNAVDAIIHQARAHRVSLIVVGTSPRSWLERLLSPSVAAEVVQRADRTVLVAPRTTAPPGSGEARAARPGAVAQEGSKQHPPTSAIG